MLPNVLTTARILLTPIFIICLFYEAPWSKPAALGIFIIASITDAIDGQLARSRGRVTKAGAFLDPLADKILVSSAFISFAIMGKIPYWMVALIVFRDLFITGLRMLFLSRDFSMITSKSAKLKTGVQVFAIIFILFYLSLKTFSILNVNPFIFLIEFFDLVYYVAFLVTIFTVYTGLNYLYVNRDALVKFVTSTSERP